MLCEDLEGWDAERGGKLEAEGDVCIMMADLHFCMAETDTL